MSKIVCFEQDFPKTDSIKNFFDFQMHTYSLDTNMFTVDTSKSDMTVNYANSKIDASDYEQKFYKLFDSPLTY